MAAVKMRATRTRKAPFFDPEQGCWKYLPVDLTVRQTLIEKDDSGDPKQPVALYESEEKGLVPMRFATEAQLALLPSNWQEIAYVPGGALAPTPVLAK